MSNVYATGKHGLLRIRGTRYRTESWSLALTTETDTVGHDNDWYNDTNPTTSYVELTVTYRGEQPELASAVYEESYRPVPKEQINYTVITPEETHTGEHLVPTGRQTDGEQDSTLTDELTFRVDRPDRDPSGGSGERQIAIGDAAVSS
jgi:hypothetical protein